MNLFYYKDPIGNFGDDLNPWIWYSFLPDVLASEGDDVFVGIGTLINSRAPKYNKKYVFGSGVGYHGFPDVGDGTWDFDFVRGPLSAQKLGLPNDKFITDPAILVSLLVNKNVQKSPGMISYMPHHASAKYADWRSICKEVGFTYLDPADDIHQTIHSMLRSELVIAEAMHAAIVADALRVPWIPVVAYDHILEFKWLDWCQTLDLDYSPIKLPIIWDMEKNYGSGDRLKFSVKRKLKSVGIWSEAWWPPVPVTNANQTKSLVIDRLANIAKSEKPILSGDQINKIRIEQIIDRINLLKTRYV